MEPTSEPKITRILLTVTHDNKTYQLIEVGIHCCYQGLEWLMFPNDYIIGQCLEMWYRGMQI